MGGYLVHIDSENEYQGLIQALVRQGYDNNIFYIGGRRDGSSSSYYWIDKDGNAEGDALNAAGSPILNHWLAGEPTFFDKELNLNEDVMDLFYYKDKGDWVINDVPRDLVGAVSSYSGRVGYICEFD